MTSISRNGGENVKDIVFSSLHKNLFSFENDIIFHVFGAVKLEVEHKTTQISHFRDNPQKMHFFFIYFFETGYTLL